MRHPFGLDKEQIRDLCAVWLLHVYWHAIDPKSYGEPTERIKARHKREAKTISRREEILATGRAVGWPDSYSLAQWEDEQEAKRKAREAAKEAAKPKPPPKPVIRPHVRVGKGKGQRPEQKPQGPQTKG